MTSTKNYLLKDLEDNLPVILETLSAGGFQSKDLFSNLMFLNTLIFNMVQSCTLVTAKDYL